MKIACIGSGNVAWHFCHRFYSSGIPIEFIFGRNPTSVAELAREVQSVGICDIGDFQSDVDVCIIAVHDDAIRSTAESLQNVFSNTILVHTSGTVSKEVLSPYYAHYGVMYPYQSVTRGIELPYDQLPIIIDGESDETIQQLDSISSLISPMVEYYPEVKRQTLHLAGVFTNNFTNAILSVAFKICQTEGISFDLALPLLRETIRKVHVSDPDSVQTGPALRGDIKTVSDHLEKLKLYPEWQSLYEEISRLINPELFRKEQSN